MGVEGGGVLNSLCYHQRCCVVGSREMCGGQWGFLGNEPFSHRHEEAPPPVVLATGRMVVLGGSLCTRWDGGRRAVIVGVAASWLRAFWRVVNQTIVNSYIENQFFGCFFVPTTMAHTAEIFD